MTNANAFQHGFDSETIFKMSAPASARLIITALNKETTPMVIAGPKHTDQPTEEEVWVKYVVIVAMAVSAVALLYTIATLCFN
jgi:hypothetical protein